MNATATDRATPPVRLRIGELRLDAGTGGTSVHVNPATGRPDAEIPLAGAEEVGRAVDTAHEAFAGWRRTKPAQRGRALFALADLLDEHRDELARRGVLDNGTPISTARLMVRQASEWTRYYAGWADKLTGEVTGSFADAGEVGYTIPQPYGVIGVIVTWNGPLVSLCMKVPAALAAGNTVVAKPSELTPFSGELFMDLASEAGIPAGVVNVLPGTAEAGEALVAHPLVQKLSFTGGPVTARKILGLCAEHMKPAVLELGGKSPNIVFADADLDAACGLGTFMVLGVLSGQGCALPTRMLVERSVYEEAVARVAATAATIAVGDPFDRETVSGPVISERALERILAMIERAKADGARLVCGGERLARDGFFVAPTVFADVDPQSELAQQEVFGPVLAMTPFDDEADAIDIANATPYGLSSYVQTRDVQRAHRVAEELDAGEVLINGGMNMTPNRPFGGVRLSGYGKEGGRAGIDAFVRTKGVAIGRLQ
jgi:aldehyde dehydrogenase (NAD+)